MTRLETSFDRFMAGVASAEQLIAAAYGAKGGNVMLCGGESNQIFDDGFKALQMLEPSDVVSREAVSILFGAAAAAHGLVGDGTSTTVLLTAALIRAGRKLRDEGFSAREVSAAIRKCASDVIEHMKEHAVAPDEADVCAAVTLAMHGDERVGGMIGSFLHKAGENAVVVANHVMGGKEITLDMKEGLVWKSGVMAKPMLRGGTRVDMEGVHVVMCATPMADMQSAEWAAINHALKSVGAKSLLLICPEAQGTVLATFTRNATDGHDWCIVGVPDKLNAFDFLSDLAAVIGGKVIDDIRGNIGDQFDVSWLGYIPGISITDSSSCIDLNDVTLKTNVERLRVELEEQLQDQEVASKDALKDALKNRLRFLSGFYAAINIPWISQGQFSAIRESVDDGVLAGRAALKGVLPGCSKALTSAIISVFDLNKEENQSGIALELHLAFSRTWAIQVDGVIPVRNSLKEYWNTVDTRTGACVDARQAGIIDSLAVLETAVNIAVEVAIPIIETNILIVAESDSQAVLAAGANNQ